jgi:ubiquinone/menaquinone biosynthesis C-methylase UbiE
MGLYSERIFPWIIDKVMANKVLAAERQRVLSEVRGNILEIGFGTGLNLPHYPQSVDHLTVLDPNAGMHKRAAARLAAARFKVTSIRLAAEARLPIDDGQFDTIVSTWTMCSIPRLDQALVELNRVLKPGGRLLFIEHGLSPDTKIARWQNRLNPINKRIGDGCNLNRNFAAIVGASPLTLEHCDQYYLPKSPRIAAWTYRGVATKRAAPSPIQD